MYAAAAVSVCFAAAASSPRATCSAAAADQVEHHSLQSAMRSWSRSRSHGDTKLDIIRQLKASQVSLTKVLVSIVETVMNAPFTQSFLHKRDRGRRRRV